MVAPTNPAPDVFADLLLEAAETGYLMDTIQLLSELTGPAMVRAAVGICIDRKRTALLRDTTPEAPVDRSGSREDAPEPRAHLVRRLPDPLAANRAGQEGRTDR